MRIYKVGVIGLGHQATEDHIPAVIASPDTELVAVADVDPQALDRFVQQHPGVVAYADYKELLADTTIDFVIIAVPHHNHFEITKDALESGKHVLKEKPFVTTLVEGKMLEEISRQQGKEIMVTLQRRFNPIYTTFIQLLQKIGTPYFVNIRYTFHTDEPHMGWRGQKNLSGGCLIDMGYHMIDLLIWYFGLPGRVYAEASHYAKEGVEYDAEDTATVSFHYNDRKLFGNMLISRVIPPKREHLHVYGSRGSIHLDRGSVKHFDVEGNLKESLTRENQWPSAAQDQIEYFVKVIEGTQPNIGSPTFHLQHLAFVSAAYESIETAEAVEVEDMLKKYG